MRVDTRDKSRSPTFRGERGGPTPEAWEGEVGWPQASTSAPLTPPPPPHRRGRGESERRLRFTAKFFIALGPEQGWRPRRIDPARASRNLASVAANHCNEQRAGRRTGRAWRSFWCPPARPGR